MFICLCTVGIYGAAEACTFQTTSGDCINSHAWGNIKGRQKIPPDDQDYQLERSVFCFLGVRWRQTGKQNLNSNLTFQFKTSQHVSMQ